ncbi:MAG: diacylglycerol/lipid kinase family protein [Bacteroidia bacterium]
MKTLLITNPCANGGRSLHVLRKVEHFLSSHAISQDTLHTPESRDIAPPDWRNYSRVILIGGDGTLHRLLNYWGIPPLPVCLVSGGSGNDFSRLVHQSARIDIQLKHFLEGKTFFSDLGLCNGVHFATGLGIGFDGKVADVLKKNSRWKSHLTYLIAVIIQIFLYREKHIQVEHDGVTAEGPSLLFTIGNGSEFGGGFKVTPQASFRDGVFQCCWIGRVPLIQRILHLSKIEKGTHAKLPFVRLFDAKSVRLQAKELLVCHMDGEVYRWQDFDISIQAGVLELIA